ADLDHPPPDRLGHQPRRPGGPASGRRAQGHQDLRDHRHGGGRDQHAGHLRVQADRCRRLPGRPGLFLCDGLAAPVPGAAGALRRRTADRNVRASYAHCLRAPAGHRLPRSPMSPTLLTLLTFGAVVAAVAGAYSILSDLYLRDRSRVSQRIDDEFRMRQRERARKALLFKDLNQLAAEAAGDMEPQSNLSQWLTTMVDQSGEDLSIRNLMIMSVAAAVLFGALVGIWRESVLPALAAAAVAAAMPVLNVHLKRNARLEKLRSQLPDAFDLMGRVVRAGQTLSQGFQAVADEFPPPVGAEFSYCYEQQTLGLPADVAMRDLSRRTGVLELKIFVTAVLVQQQTGGSLAEMLDKLAGVIRQRYRIRG